MSRITRAAEALRDAMDHHTTPTGRAAVVLNPLRYAWVPHACYIERFAPSHPVRAVWVGMNPGPWGMAQTGVPFGSVPMVRDYLGITGEVEVPANTHPKRPIRGFATPRSEVSGDRLWGAVREAYPEPKGFFETTFVTNYCPLVWQSETGANITPDKLPAKSSKRIFEACDAHLRAVIGACEPEWVIGVGVWAEKVSRRVVEVSSLPVRVGRILHPSPASPAANRGWASAARSQLQDMGCPLGEPEPR